MINETTQPTAVKGTHATLHLDGTGVGDIVVQGWDASWTYGTFKPNAAFARFAAIFGRWSLMMHEDEDKPLTPQLSQILRDAELQMDNFRARVHFPHDDAWRDVAQLNIDAGTIEWKEV